MKLQCKTKNLKDAVSKASRVVGKQLALEVLALVLLEAKDNTLSVRATNLDLGVEFKLASKVKTPGKVAVPGKILSGFLSGLPGGEDGEVSLSLINNNLSVEANNANTLIKAENVEDYPMLPKIDKEDEVSSSFTTSVEDLVSGVDSVSYAAASSDIKPEIASIYFKLGGDSLMLVATDLFRLASKQVAIMSPDIKDEVADCIVPARNAVEAVRMLEGEEESITVSISAGQINFESPKVYVTSRLVEGNYPSYEQIIPKGFTTKTILIKQDLIGALRASSNFFDNFNQIQLTVDTKEELFEISAKAESTGESAVRLTGTIEGDTVSIKINARYLTDCLNVINGDSVSVSFNGGDKAMQVKDINDPSFFYLLMPLNN